MDYKDFFCDRISTLRVNEDISEYKMSLDLGHSRSYIQGISSGRTMPSMDAFFEICEYLNVTPAQFFNCDMEDSAEMVRLIDLARRLDKEDLSFLVSTAQHLYAKKRPEASLYEPKES